MTNQEIIDELSSLVRQSEDAARAADAGASAFRAEYEALCSAPGAVNHERMSEIYTYVAHRPRDARRLRKKAEMFRRAIVALGSGATTESTQR